MKKEILLHIPHSSYKIPQKYKSLFLIKDKELKFEQIKMTDSYTQELFNLNFDKIIFPISRLICDVERFRDEKNEEMTTQGMWVCYTKTSELKPLKSINSAHKQEILKNYYDKHHKKFENKVNKILNKNKKCLIIDCHSFPSKSLPYELHSNNTRPEICIGTDKFHTPKELTNLCCKEFKSLGYKTQINSPFIGSIVPLKFYNQNENVISLMIELNRSLYMNEKNGNKNSNFLKLKQDIKTVINKINEKY